MNINAKRRIASAAAKQVPPGCALLINIGTMTEEAERALSHHQGLHVATNMADNRKRSINDLLDGTLTLYRAPQ